jgi:hypothetical protein
MHDMKAETLKDVESTDIAVRMCYEWTIRFQRVYEN